MDKKGMNGRMNDKMDGRTEKYFMNGEVQLELHLT